jgi:predicted NBD/HSP70 family sugar kinase
VIDIGGTNLKIGLSARKPPIKIPSGPEMSAAKMVAAVKKATADWSYDAVSIGYPGPVRLGHPAEEPKNLGSGWVTCDFEKELGRPVKVVNDAALQALGNYRGGRLLFLGFGTGVGSALVAEGVLMPMDLVRLPYRGGVTYDEYVGARARKRLGCKRWSRHVARMVEQLRRGLLADDVVLGGGGVKKLRKRPPGARRSDPARAILGGIHLWAPISTWLRVSEPTSEAGQAG